MSTTDRQQIYRKPCSCGSGEYIANECMPDHPYARVQQTWWEGIITCPPCKAKYSIIRFANHMVRVKKGATEQNLKPSDILEVLCKAVPDFGPEPFVSDEDAAIIAPHLR